MPKEDAVAGLFQTIRMRHGRERMDAVESLSRRKISAAWWPDLLELIRGKKHGLMEPRLAIVAAGKMKDPPPEVMDELIAATQPGYQGTVPQYFSEAAKSAVAIDPNDPRLPDALAQGLTVDNYQIQKSAVEALMKIDSTASRQILSTIRERLPREYTEQLVIKLLERVDAYLASAGGGAAR